MLLFYFQLTLDSYTVELEFWERSTRIRKRDMHVLRSEKIIHSEKGGCFPSDILPVVFLSKSLVNSRVEVRCTISSPQTWFHSI